MVSILLKRLTKYIGRAKILDKLNNSGGDYMSGNDIKGLKDCIFQVMETEGGLKSYIDFNNFVEYIYNKYDIKYKLPIDIDKLLNLFGLSYKKETMNSDIQLGYFTKTCNNPRIVINKDIKYILTRSTVTYCLLNFILEESTFEMMYNPRLVSWDPSFYKKINMANLMLLPLGLFKDEFLLFLTESEKYTGINNKQLDIWIDALSNKSQIDEFQLMGIYPILCNMTSYMADVEFKNNVCNMDNQSEKTKKYNKLFGDF